MRARGTLRAAITAFVLACVCGSLFVLVVEVALCVLARHLSCVVARATCRGGLPSRHSFARAGLFPLSWCCWAHARLPSFGEWLFGIKRAGAGRAGLHVRKLVVKTPAAVGIICGGCGESNCRSLAVMTYCVGNGGFHNKNCDKVKQWVAVCRTALMDSPSISTELSLEQLADLCVILEYWRGAAVPAGAGARARDCLAHYRLHWVIERRAAHAHGPRGGGVMTPATCAARRGGVVAAPP